MGHSNHESAGAPTSTPEPAASIDNLEAKRAAEILQTRADDARRTFRGHRTRRELRGFGLDASTRLTEAVKDVQFQEEIQSPVEAETRRQTDETPASPARANWSHVLKVAKRAAQDDRSSSSGSDNDDHCGQEADSALSPEQQAAMKKRRQEARELGRNKAKMMELQYWLEFVDSKHRHGSNLRKYHQHWQQQDTQENFFHWLDQGDGKHLDLPECTRERLDSQQVRYLSREERQNYLVQVDAQGLLIWAKNGQKVWTKDELYKDSMLGIVPSSDPTPAFQHNIAPETSSSESSSSSSDDSESDSGEDEHSLTTAPDEGENYINEDFHRAGGPAKLKYVSAGVVFNHMIRKSLQKGYKWIFVCDTSLRLYIGYKQTGAFQHSSFMHGSRILAAGQIKVKDGQLRRLSPLSGHYRAPAANFRTFVKSLKALDVDTSHVSISRSYAVLVGIEGYTKSRRRIKKAEAEVAYQKNKVLNPEKLKEEEEKKLDNSKSAAREREFLKQQQLAEAKAVEEAKLTRRSSRKRTMSQLFERLGLKPRSSGSVEGVLEERRTGPEDGIPPPEGPLLRK